MSQKEVDIKPNEQTLVLRRTVIKVPMERIIFFLWKEKIKKNHSFYICRKKEKSVYFLSIDFYFSL